MGGLDDPRIIEAFLHPGALNGGIGDGVDAPRRHQCAKVEVLITT